MRIFILTLMCFVFSCEEGTGEQLNRVAKSSSGDRVQTYFIFDEVPVFDDHLRNKRLDLLLFNTTATDNLTIPDPDDVIVKTLVIGKPDHTVVSLFFRYLPQDLKVNQGDGSTLIIDLMPGNRFTGTYRNLTSKLGKVTPISTPRRTIVNPLTFSPYAHNWRSFFEDYETASDLKPHPKLYFPSFPLVELLPEMSSPETTNMMTFIHGLNRQAWFKSLTEIQQRIAESNLSREKEYLAITHADILYRLGNIETAIEQFKLVERTFPGKSSGVLAAYAAALIEGQNRRYHDARVNLRTLLTGFHHSHWLLPYVHLSIAELAFASGQYLKIREHLDVLQNSPPALVDRVNLRSADFHFVIGSYSEAHRQYQQLSMTQPINGQPLSLNGFCSTLYDRQKFNESFNCYQRLARILEDPEHIAHAFHLAALSALKSGESHDTDTLLHQITEDFPGTKAAMRAEMKLADICYLRENDCFYQAEDVYHRLSQESINRNIAEEASLKYALIHHLAGNDAKSIGILHYFLRNFQSGKLRGQAHALLIALLPGVLERLLLDGHDLEAIALAQRNRNIFENRWVDTSLLFQLSLAFERLSLYTEALHLLLYAKNQQKLDDENLYLALTRVAHSLADHHLVENVSSEYFYNYPQGQHRLDVLFYRIDSLYSSGLMEEALILLPDELPDRNDYLYLTASIRFHQNDFIGTTELLLPIYEDYSSLPENQIYFLAESLFKSNKFEACADLYKRLAVDTNEYRDLALYRLNQLQNKGFITEEIAGWSGALSQDFRDWRWQKFAAQSARYEKLTANL